MDEKIKNTRAFFSRLHKNKYFYPVLAIAFLFSSIIGAVTNLGSHNLSSRAATAFYTAGVQQIGSTMDSGNNNMLSATQVTTGPNTGLLTSISVYIGKIQAAPSNHMQVALYADNGSNAPGTFLMSSTSQALSAQSWNTFAMNPVAITANTNYWLTFNVDGKNTQYAIGSASTPRAAWKSKTIFSTWPNPFGTPTQKSKEQYSIFMTYAADIPPATPTASPTPTIAATPTIASASPTIIPSPTVFGSPTPTVMPGDCTPPSCYRNTTNTGVPAGTTFTTTVNGDYTVKTAGEKLNGWHITGNLIIASSSATIITTITNSQIDGTVTNEVGQTHYGPFMISDSTIGPVSGCITAPGLGESDYTATRVQVRGHDDGFRMSGSNVNVSDSYAHLCWNPPSIAPPDGSHSDGLQNYCPSSPIPTVCHNLVFDHNTIDEHDISWNTGMNVGSNSDGPDVSNVTITNNMFWGGTYVMWSQWREGPIWKVYNNRIVNGAWSYAPVTTEGTCANQDWSGNSLVTIDSNYQITSTVAPFPFPCVN